MESEFFIVIKLGVFASQISSKFFVFVIVAIGSRTLCMLGKLSSTEL